MSDTNIQNIDLEQELTKLRLPKKIEKEATILGKVISVSPDMITVDVGYRAEGQISGGEMYIEGDNTLPKVGEEILVYVINDGAALGAPKLSIKRTGAHKKWIDLERAVGTGELVEVTVTEVNTGGVMVALPAGIKGFIPASHLDQSRLSGVNAGKVMDGKVASQLIEVLQPMIGQKVKVKVLEVDKKKTRVLLSERQAMSSSSTNESVPINNAMRAELISRIKVGDVMDSTITGIAPFGLFVNANGIEGLVHISQISWEKVDDPSTIYKVGEKIKIKVISVDEEGKRVGFSLKMLEKDPWEHVNENYQVGQTVEGEVTKITDYGAFIKVEDGINGLVHNSEVNQNSTAKAMEYMREGDKVKLKIISINKADRHLGLSLRAVNSTETQVQEGENA
jgi:small subunit ribosomal protein S1